MFEGSGFARLVGCRRSRQSREVRTLVMNWNASIALALLFVTARR